MENEMFVNLVWFLSGALSFKLISSLYNKLKLVNKNFKYLSIGMSNDYKLAINEGGNMIRIGSRIFGER